MNENTAKIENAGYTLAPDDLAFLEAIQNKENRETVITILKRAGLIHG